MTKYNAPLIFPLATTDNAIQPDSHSRRWCVPGKWRLSRLIALIVALMSIILPRSRCKEYRAGIVSAWNRTIKLETRHTYSEASSALSAYQHARLLQPPPTLSSCHIPTLPKNPPALPSDIPNLDRRLWTRIWRSPRSGKTTNSSVPA